jgi:hypothetical protein
MKRVVVERVPDAEALTFRANEYSKNDGNDSGWKAMLLTKVVIGNGKKLVHDDTSLTQPPEGFDSVSFFPANFSVVTLIGRLGSCGGGPRWISKLR